MFEELGKIIEEVVRKLDEKINNIFLMFLKSAEKLHVDSSFSFWNC
ncbi:MAG: hypothetical protein QXD89_01745 [Candidatus Aenigmatarchaeota archaeon]